MPGNYPDIADLQIGQEIAVLKKKPDRVQIARFAGATGDFNPIHVDEEFGKKALGGTIVHGLCIMGFISQLMTDWLGDPGALKKLGVRFNGMVRPGEEITILGTLSKKEKREGHYWIVCDVAAENEKREKVQIGTAEAVVPL